MAALLGEAPGFDNGNRRLLDAAERNARRPLKLVEGILELARLEEGDLPVRRANVPLAGLVDEVLQMAMPAAECHRLELISEVPDGLPRVIADPDLVARVLENLVGNGVELGEPGAGPVCVSARVDGAMFELQVRDTGRGGRGEPPPADLREIRRRNPVRAGPSRSVFPSQGPRLPDAGLRSRARRTHAPRPLHDSPRPRDPRL